MFSVLVSKHHRKNGNIVAPDHGVQRFMTSKKDSNEDIHTIATSKRNTINTITKQQAWR